MADNSMKPTEMSVETFLESVSEKRHAESRILIDMMQEISSEQPVMWGPSIIGFGAYHYKYDTGREGDMPMIGFSPRKQAITVYIADGFDSYGPLLDTLGRHTTSARRWSRRARARSVSSISMLSVSSSVRSPGVMPVSASTLATIAVKPSSRNWRAEMFTIMCSGAPPASHQRR